MSVNTEITGLLARLAEAWNAGDAGTYAGLFTEDADYIVFNGTHIEGRAAIESSHRRLFDGPLKGSTMSVPNEQIKVKPLADAAVLVIAGGGTDLAGELRESTVSFTAVSTPEGWRFASFQNTRVAR